MINIANLGCFDEKDGLINLNSTSDNKFHVGENGVTSIVSTGDKKVEFISFDNHCLAYVKSALGYNAYYPVERVEIKRPIKAVLMDLDGTSVKSEEFWIWIIQKSIASLLNDESFKLEESDLPHVSGHSVSEHLQYCINKYCPDKKLEDARNYYFYHTEYEMNEIMEGRGKEGAFTPTKGLKDFLMALKERNIKIGLVTSGLYQKAMPEIISAFKTLNMGDPKDFYDSIISAGFPLKKGSVGTLGELSPKPHPWLYAETCTVGLNIPYEDRNSVVGIEDSGAGVCSIRLAGYPTIGISGGNIISSGTKSICNYYADDFKQILDYIDGK